MKDRHLHSAVSTTEAKAWEEALLDAYSLAFGRSWLHLRCTQQTNRHTRSARAGVRALMDWVRALPEGMPRLQALKGLGAWWRRVAVSSLNGEDKPPGAPALASVFRGTLALAGYTVGQRSRILHQMSRFGRAGPGPINSQIVASKEVHIQDLTRDPKVGTVGRHLRSLRRFARVWSHGRRGGASYTIPTAVGATYESTRKQGGLLGLVRRSITELKARELDAVLKQRLDSCCADLPYALWGADDVQNLGGGASCEGGGTLVGNVLFPYQEDYLFLDPPVGPQEWEILVEHLFGYASMMLALQDRITAGELPDCRQVAIEERGMKVRIVTPISGCDTYVSLILNSSLLRLMGSDPRLNPVSEFPLLDSLDRLRVRSQLREADVIRSVDMARASDLIPHSVAKALVDGLCDGLGWPPFLEQAFRRAVGPHVMHLGSDRKVVTTSGILMGSGVTWPLLSLYNLWLWESSWRDVRPRGWRSKAVRGRCRVVGDDLVGVAPQEVSNRYTELLLETGGEPSYGKDLLSVSWGVLVEEIFNSERGMDLALHYPTVSVREIQPTARVGPGGALTPPWACGPALSLLWARHQRPGWLLGVINARYSDEIAKLRKHRLSPFLPRVVGGGGFPSLTSEAGHIAALRAKWLRALRCAMSQGSRGVALLSRLPSAWLPRREQVLSRAEDEFWRNAAAETVVLRSTEDASLDQNQPTLGDCADRAVAVVSSAVRLRTGSVVRCTDLTPGMVQKRLGEVLESLNSLVPFPALADRPRDMAKGLYKWLENQVRAPVHPVSFLSVTHVLTVSRVGHD